MKIKTNNSRKIIRMKMREKKCERIRKSFLNNRNNSSAVFFYLNFKFNSLRYGSKNKQENTQKIKDKMKTIVKMNKKQIVLDNK